MGRKKNLDKFSEVMFSDLPETTLTPVERLQLVRYRDCFTQSLERPTISDTELRDYLVNHYDISQSQAYRDIGHIRILLGNVKNMSREWARYIMNETLKKAIEQAKEEGNLTALILAVDKLAKYNNLDKEEIQEIPWDDIEIQQIEPTMDPSILGMPALENRDETIGRLLKKYSKEIDIVEVDYKEVK